MRRMVGSGVSRVTGIAAAPAKVARTLPLIDKASKPQTRPFPERLEAKAKAALEKHQQACAEKYCKKPWYGRSHGTWPGVTGSIKLGQPCISRTGNDREIIVFVPDDRGTPRLRVLEAVTL
ncbi:hypothetical protein HYT84_04930 [Candidatus Micrarchaeota archaeon]|nr:hypothetical protein [Candidatus Micrarchaeota archaeon]